LLLRFEHLWLVFEDEKLVLVKGSMNYFEVGFGEVVKVWSLPYANASHSSMGVSH
jgi:hypothetical protein